MASTASAVVAGGDATSPVKTPKGLKKPRKKPSNIKNVMPGGYNFMDPPRFDSGWKMKYQPHQQSSTTKVGEGVKINTISGGYNGWYQGVFGITTAPSNTAPPPVKEPTAISKAVYRSTYTRHYPDPKENKPPTEEEMAARRQAAALMAAAAQAEPPEQRPATGTGTQSRPSTRAALTTGQPGTAGSRDTTASKPVPRHAITYLKVVGQYTDAPHFKNQKSHYQLQYGEEKRPYTGQEPLSRPPSRVLPTPPPRRPTPPLTALTNMSAMSTGSKQEIPKHLLANCKVIGQYSEEPHYKFYKPHYVEQYKERPARYENRPLVDPSMPPTPDPIYRAPFITSARVKEKVRLSMWRGPHGLHLASTLPLPSNLPTAASRIPSDNSGVRPVSRTSFGRPASRQSSFTDDSRPSSRAAAAVARAAVYPGA